MYPIGIGIADRVYWFTLLIYKSLMVIIHKEKAPFRIQNNHYTYIDEALWCYLGFT